MRINNLDVFLWRFKRFSKIAINYATCFNTSATALPYTTCLTPNNSRARNNFLSPHPPIVSHVILCDERKHVGYKTCQYNSVRYFSNVSTDSVAGIQAPMQYNSIFKAISESAPIKVTQDSLLFVHDYTGLPWWSIVVLTTVFMRSTLTLPLSLYQLYIFAKLENLKYEMDKIIEEIKIEINYGTLKYNWPKKYATRLYNRSVKKQWNKLIVRENCHPAKAGLLVLAQVPLWISLSMSIRNLCYMLPKQDASAYTTYREFTTEGVLWMSNLTIADPFVLPVAMGLFNLAIIEINRMSRVKELTKWQRYVTNFLRVVTIGMIPVAMYVPSCLSLYWATSSAFGLFQNLILLSPKLRRFAKVPVTTSESPRPYLRLYNGIAARCRFEKKLEIPPKI